MTILTCNNPSILKFTSNGISTAGELSIPGIQIGDVLFKIEQPGFIEGFEIVVSTDGQLQQTFSADWSGISLTFYFLRGTYS